MNDRKMLRQTSAKRTNARTQARQLKKLNRWSQANQKIQELEKSRKDLLNTTSNLEDSMYGNEIAIDDVQQYLRRDCLEVVGIPRVPQDNPIQLVQEVGSLIDVDIGVNDISTAHRLPDTKKVKNRIIVKFVRRDKRE